MTSWFVWKTLSFGETVERDNVWVIWTYETKCAWVGQKQSFVTLVKEYQDFYFKLLQVFWSNVDEKISEND